MQIDQLNDKEVIWFCYYMGNFQFVLFFNGLAKLAYFLILNKPGTYLNPDDDDDYDDYYNFDVIVVADDDINLDKLFAVVDLFVYDDDDDDDDYGDG